MSLKTTFITDNILFYILLTLSQMVRADWSGEINEDSQNGENKKAKLQRAKLQTVKLQNGENT